VGSGVGSSFGSGEGSWSWSPSRSGCGRASGSASGLSPGLGEVRSGDEFILVPTSPFPITGEDVGPSSILADPSSRTSSAGDFGGVVGSGTIVSEGCEGCDPFCVSLTVVGTDVGVGMGLGVGVDELGKIFCAGGGGVGRGCGGSDGEAELGSRVVVPISDESTSRSSLIARSFVSSRSCSCPKLISCSTSGTGRPPSSSSSPSSSPSRSPSLAPSTWTSNAGEPGLDPDRDPDRDPALVLVVLDPDLDRFDPDFLGIFFQQLPGVYLDVRGGMLLERGRECRVEMGRG
jgi:hypothetical protein